MTSKLVLIELNEVNISLLDEYLSDELYINRWPNLRKMLALPSVKTVSEQNYHSLEPWIQWASVHTGLSAEEHGIFRLGDINLSKHPQIFETMEMSGLTVGCISAMNADNRLKQPAYFIPDPWTITNTDGSFTSEAVYSALYQAVNDNASGRLTKKTVASLLFAMLTHSKVRNWPLYLKQIIRVVQKRKWNKALFLDLFISDLHQSLYKKTNPDFTTVFFNGFAHLQHHYFFSSKYYTGTQSNPSWYIDSDDDPFPDALDIYDVIIGQHLKLFKDSEVVIATGLQQIPYQKHAFYYRLLNHEAFLNMIGIKNVDVKPRMTRDFLLECGSPQHAKFVEKQLAAISLNDIQFFGEIDNRGDSLFVTLTYGMEISPEDYLHVSDDQKFKILEHLAFVAVKNGMHDGIGHVYSSAPNNTFKNLDGEHVKNLYNYLSETLTTSRYL